MSHDDEDQDDTMTCGLSVAERELLQAKLAALPDTVPPRAVWQRIEAQARAEGLLRRRPPGPAVRWLAGAGLAAAVVLGVLNVDLVPTGTNEPEGSFPTEPAYTASDQAVRLTPLHALMVESRQLEEDLRSLPEQPELVRAGTAAAIATVEDQIAAIDYQLNYSPVKMTDEQMELYWRERVRLMNLLVQLRTAQAQRRAF